MILPEWDTRVKDSETGGETMVIDELPIITVPDDIFAQADNSNGMKIKYSKYGVNPFAEDDIDDFVEVICSPPTNKIFPIGETLVTCSATDSGGNTATASFYVTVEGTGGNIVGDLIPNPIQPPP